MDQGCQVIKALPGQLAIQYLYGLEPSEIARMHLGLTCKMETPSGKRQLILTLVESWSTKFSRLWDMYAETTSNSQGSLEDESQFVFAVKHDGCHKARLVAGGHLTRQ